TASRAARIIAEDGSCPSPVRYSCLAAKLDAALDWDIVLARMRHGVRSCPARVASAIPGATSRSRLLVPAKRFQLYANGGLHARGCDARPSSKFGHTVPHYGFFERPGQPRKRGKTSTQLT